MSQDQPWFGRPPAAPASRGRVGRVAATVAGLALLAQQPVHRRGRAQVAALVQQGGVHTGRCSVPEALGVQHLQHPRLLGHRQCPRLGCGRRPRPTWWWRWGLPVAAIPARARLANRPAGPHRPHRRRQGGHPDPGCPSAGRLAGCRALGGPVVAARREPAERRGEFPWTSITLAWRATWSRSRAFSRPSRACSRPAGRPAVGPGAAATRSAPLSRCLRHSVISEVYRPSRRSSAPLPALSSCSFSPGIRSL